MRKIIIILLLIIPVTAIAQTQGLSKIQGLSLSELRDVSTANAQTGNALIKTARGWKAGPVATDISSTSNQQILYNNAGVLSGTNNMIYDGTDFFVKKSSGLPSIVVENTGGSVAIFEARSTTNYWWWGVNGINAFLEPQTTNGVLQYRDLANTTLFSFDFLGKLFTIESGAYLEVSGLGTNATSITGLDAQNRVTTATIGAGLSLSSGTLSTDQTMAETSYDNSTSGLTATNGKAAVDEVVGLIPDNISDLTISADVDINNNKLINVTDGAASSDAATYGQLTASHALDLIAGVDGDTIVLDTRETLLVIDGNITDPATFYIDGSGVSSGAKLYIKYGNFSGNATIDRDDDNDPGNFLATGSTSGSTTLTYTGTGTSMLLKSGPTWYQMY